MVIWSHFSVGNSKAGRQHGAWEEDWWSGSLTAGWSDWGASKRNSGISTHSSFFCAGLGWSDYTDRTFLTSSLKGQGLAASTAEAEWAKVLGLSGSRMHTSFCLFVCLFSGCILWLKPCFEWDITPFDFAWCLLVQIPAVWSSLQNERPVTQLLRVRLLLTQTYNRSSLFELLSFILPPGTLVTTISSNCGGNLALDWVSFQFSALPAYESCHLLLFHMISIFLL